MIEVAAEHLTVRASGGRQRPDDDASARGQRIDTIRHQAPQPALDEIPVDGPADGARHDEAHGRGFVAVAGGDVHHEAPSRTTTPALDRRREVDATAQAVPSRQHR